jgi:hypothetical protein
MVELVLHPVDEPLVKFEFVTRFWAWRPVILIKCNTTARVRLFKGLMGLKKAFIWLDSGVLEEKSDQNGSDMINRS